MILDGAGQNVPLRWDVDARHFFYVALGDDDDCDVVLVRHRKPVGMPRRTTKGKTGQTSIVLLWHNTHDGAAAARVKASTVVRRNFWNQNEEKKNFFFLSHSRACTTQRRNNAVLLSLLALCFFTITNTTFPPHPRRHRHKQPS